MKKISVISLILIIFSSCGYRFVTVNGKKINIGSVEVTTSIFPGIEADMDNRLTENFLKRGYRLYNGCPQIFVNFVSPSGSNYFFTKEGKVSKTYGYAIYKVKIEKCDGKTIKKTVKIPIKYVYFSDPKKTIGVEKSHIISSVDILTDEIIKMLR